MDVTLIDSAPVREREVRGTVVRMQSLLSADAPDGLNFRLVRSEFRGGDRAFTTPRHHHAFQQVRWAESGTLNYAPDRFIREGDLAYFSRGVWYGPQRKDNGISVALQFGFDGECQYAGAQWARYRDEAIQELESRGSFDGGTYVEDTAGGGERRMDSVEAIHATQYQLRTGKQFRIPTEGYAQPILLHPDAFSYHDAGWGVERKPMGRFYDHAGPQADLTLSMVRVDRGAELTLGKERAQLLWTPRGGLRVDGTPCGGAVAVYSPLGEALPIGADEVTEAHVVDFPRLD